MREPPRLADQQFAEIFERITDAFVALDTDWRYTYVNRKAAEILGRAQEDLIGTHIWTEFPEGVGQPFYHAYHKAMAEQVPVQIEEYYPPYDRWFENRIYPSPDGLSIYFRDVSERKRADEGLREAQRRLTTLIGNLPGVAYRCRNDEDYTVDFISDGVRAMTGYSPADFIERKVSFGALIHPDDQKPVWNSIQTALQENQPYKVVYRFRTASGEEKWFWEQGRGIAAPSGAPVFLEGFITDITEHKSAEEQLRAKEARMQTLVDNIPGAVYRCAFASNWTIEFISDPIQTISGYPASDFINNSVRTYICLIEPEDWPEVERVTKAGLRRRRPYEVRYRIRHADGSQRWVHEKGQGVFDAAGELRGLDGVILDITDRKRAEEAWKESRRWLQAILDHYPGLISAKDPQGTVVLVNRNFSVLEGPSAEEFIGKNVYELFPKEIADVLWQHDLEAQEAPGPLTSEETVLHKDGSRHIYLTVKFPVREEGRLVATGAISVDISDRKRAEDALWEAHNDLEAKVDRRTKELSEANLKLKELDRLKSEFLATMSHELRTPLNSVIGFVGMILQGLTGDINPEQRKQLSMVYGSAKHLLTLINDILDLSRIESGRMEVVMEDFAVVDVIAEATETLAPAASQKGLRFLIDPEDTRLTMRSDRRKVLQIVLNLVTNAVKFTDRGEVRISCRRQRNEVELVVSDTGIGIATENMAQLFEAFRQIDGSARRRYEGTGLGLYLSRRLARLLGGTITAESEQGQGARFFVRLPIDAGRGED